MIETPGVQPNGVLEFRITGDVSGPDYDDVLIPAIETALEKYPKLRILCVFDEGFRGYNLEAAWDDARIGLRHWNVFERIAVATDVAWLKQVLRAAGFIVSCPVQVFELSEVEDARRWLRESLGSIHLEFDDASGLVTARLLGQLEPSAYEDVATQIDTWIARRSQPRLLLDLREFDGWQGLGALGEHLTLVRDHHRIFERVGIVGDEAWQKLAATLISRFVHADVRYFNSASAQEAAEWLRAKA